MSYYCSFTYKGIVKPEYRNDVKRAVEYQDWSEVRSKELKALFEGWDDYCLINLGSARKLFVDNYFRFDADSGLLEIKYEYNYRSDNGDTEEFTRRHLPFLTEQIILFHEWDEELLLSEKAYYDRTQDFRENMEKCERVYKEKGIDGIVKI